METGRSEKKAVRLVGTLRLLLAGALLLAATAWTAAASEADLHAAAEKGDVKRVRALVRSGADVDSRNDYDFTPLCQAALSGHVEVVRLLLDQGADVNAPCYYGTPLHAAAMGGHTEVAALLIAHGADVNARTRRDGRTPLHYAAIQGSVELAELLIASGADVNAENIEHSSFLNRETHCGFKSSSSRTALDLARRNGRDDVVTLLLAHQIQ